jgi:N-acetylglutamate synthase-like GNAT family acetyltransferase
MNLKSGNIEQYEPFSQFTSLTQFNHHMEMWMLEHKADFSKGELMGLKRLVRFAAKIPGVCNAKIETVLKAIHDEYNENGILRSTFKRMTQKAKELDIITIFETERKNGSQTSNLYVFNRIPSNEPPKQEIMNHPNKILPNYQ